MAYDELYIAVKNYDSTNDGEISLTEKDLVFLLEKVSSTHYEMKRATLSKRQPSGLVPITHVQLAVVQSGAIAIASYKPTSKAQISIKKDDQLKLYSSGSEWSLIGDSKGVGFVPSSCVEPTKSALKSILKKNKKVKLEPKPEIREEEAHNSEVEDSDKQRVWAVIDIDGRKKTPVTFEISEGKVGVFPSDRKAGRSWPAKNIKGFASEKKHVFVDFFDPEAGFEFVTSTRDEANAIITALGEVYGAMKAVALDEVKQASQKVGKGYKTAQVMYDFFAESKQELDCTEGDLVYIIDDKKSSEWWMCESIISGRRGVVASSYLSVMGKSGRPDSAKLRVWTDKTGEHKVKAQFDGMVGRKVQLHKSSGAKIVLAASKLSLKDLEYLSSHGVKEVEPIIERRLQKSQAAAEKVKEVKELKTETKTTETKKTKPLKSAMKRTSESKTVESKSIESKPVKLEQAESNESESKPVEINNYNESWLDFFHACHVGSTNASLYSSFFETANIKMSSLPQMDNNKLRKLRVKEVDLSKIMAVIEKRYPEAIEHQKAKRELAKSEALEPPSLALAPALSNSSSVSSLDSEPNSVGSGDEIIKGGYHTLDPFKGNKPPVYRMSRIDMLAGREKDLIQQISEKPEVPPKVDEGETKKNAIPTKEAKPAKAAKPVAEKSTKSRATVGLKISKIPKFIKFHSNSSDLAKKSAAEASEESVPMILRRPTVLRQAVKAPVMPQQAAFTAF